MDIFLSEILFFADGTFDQLLVNLKMAMVCGLDLVSRDILCRCLVGNAPESFRSLEVMRYRDYHW